jgi:hypothetical protein
LTPARSPTSRPTCPLSDHGRLARVWARFEAGREFALQRLRDLLAWGRTGRPELAELDLELSARSLLAIGEQAVRLVLADADEFSPGRYERFARQLLDLLGG